MELSATPVVAAVDIGGESGRVVAVWRDGDRLRHEERHRFLNTPITVDGHLCWDIDALERNVRDGIARVPGAASAGIDTWAVDIGLLDGDRPVAPPRCYRDRLTEGILPSVFARIPRDVLFERTGIQMMEINTLCQLVALQEREPELLGRADGFAMIPDLLLGRLGGDTRCELTNASTTQMLGLDGGWDTTVTAACGIDSAMLPALVEPGETRGRMDARTPLVGVASHDTASAVMAAPLDDTTCYISSGTWSLVGIESPVPVVGARALALNLSNERGWRGSYRVLRNVMGLWLLQECRRAFARTDGVAPDYTAMMEWARNAEPFAGVIDPDDAAFLRPTDLPSAVDDACRRQGLEPPGSRGALLRLLLESLAVRYRWTLEALADASGRTIDRITIVGGGSRNQLLCQLTADATGLPVTAGPAEATALGNGIAQLLTLGHVADLAEARALVRGSGEITRYEPHAEAAWDHLYERLRSRVAPPD